ncbi:MAG TPA: universal stress protein [Bryobacteraceae bacterium]|nr:universal stress protein [Bryobacteraceae bacterium]
MIAFRRILFPVDFSKQDQEAAPFVKAMAERFHSEVFLLHAAEFMPAWYGPPDAMALEPTLNFKGLLDERREHLIQHLSADLAGLHLRTVLEVGDPAKEIAKCARQQKIELIMMPTHGYGPFRRVLLGSVTAKVLHDTDCPVWTGVHTDQLWSQKHSEWRRFLCAVDAKEVSLLQWASQFSREQKAELQVVHAVHASAPIPASQESRSLHDFLLETAQERMAKLQAEAGTSFEIQMKFGKVGDVVREAASECQADLVLIGRGVIQGVLGGLRSEAYDIIREAPCPVISI